MNLDLPAWGLYSLVFVLSLALDVAYTGFVIDATRNRAFLSALWTGLLVLLGACLTLLYVPNPWTLVPMVLGQMAGCYLVVRLKRPVPENRGGWIVRPAERS